jgi:pimeloyl-ACP methyl ester carboxylesterase
MPNADLVMLPDSGHLPWLDDPESIARQSLA